ncbi:uncharacterized protein [Rhodnius prolixus]
MINFKGVTATLILLTSILHCAATDTRPIQSRHFFKWFHHPHWRNYHLPNHHHLYPGFHHGAMLRNSEPQVSLQDLASAYTDGIPWPLYRSSTSTSNSQHLSNLNEYNNQGINSGLPFLFTTSNAPPKYDDRRFYICPK